MALTTSLLALLPTIISVNSSTQAITNHYNYALNKGKVYWRANADYIAKCQCLLQAPHDWEELKIENANYKALAADDHALLLKTENDELWRLNTQDGKIDKKWGLPAPEKLVGLKLQERLKAPSYVEDLIYSIRHKDVAYYEDIKGNQFNWGSAGCTTVFTLNKDKQTISWGDPWFPPDLSRQLCGPKRGIKKYHAFASSASVSMALTTDGEIWTQFYDYDSNGGTPFFTYDYRPNAPLHGRPGTDKKSEPMVRALPSEEWARQPEIKLHDLARLTKRLAVLQTGQGNSARELRILGTNAKGQTGFYVKALKDPSWDFRVTNEEIEQKDFVILETSGIFYKNKDQSYRGQVIQRFKHYKKSDDTQIATVRSSDMNFHCSPITLTFELGTGETFNVLAHTVDAWTPFKDEDPEFNANFIKKLKVTLEIPQETLDHSSSAVQKFVKKHLKRDHLRAFRWAMAMNQERAELRRTTYPLHLKADTTEDLMIKLYSQKFFNRVPRDKNAFKLSTQEVDSRLKFINRLQYWAPAPLLAADALTMVSTVRYTLVETRILPSFESHLASFLVANEMALEWMKQTK